MPISNRQKLNIEFIKEFKDEIYWEDYLPKFGYKLLIYNISTKINKYQNSTVDKLKIESDNYCSDLLDLPEFIDLAIRLISLKVFQ